VAPVIETLELQSMIEEAALVIPDKDTSGIELSLHPELAGFSVLAHRVGLVQVLGNLILNAWESIKRSQSESGSIRVTARIDDSGERSLVRVTIADSGCGFTDEVHPKIFQRGFSSKRGHLSGLGLHWCANALASMGGRISAESAGADRGAEFHVVLPGSTKDAATARRRKQQGRDREVGKDREIIVAEMAGRMQREYAQR
jgi:C4-dicarboxylate-specific signal transduction histidine kinase